MKKMLLTILLTSLSSVLFAQITFMDNTSGKDPEAINTTTANDVAIIFTTNAASYNLNSATVNIVDWGVGRTDVTFTIKLADGSNEPTGSDLASQTFANQSIGYDGTYYTFTFTSLNSQTLSANTKYALIVSTTGSAEKCDCDNTMNPTSSFCTVNRSIWYNNSGEWVDWHNDTVYSFAIKVMATATASAPTTQASAVGFSSTSTSGTTIGWTRGNGDNCAVFMKEASSGNAIPDDNTTYTANTTFGSGSQIGSTGWYCVFNGSGTSVPVSGLSLSTTYRVHVCEYNGGAGSELYQTDNGTDNPDNVTTDDATITFTNGANGALNFQQFSPSPPVGNWPFGKFTLAGDATGATLNSVTVTLSSDDTYDSNDFGSNPFRLLASNTDNIGTAGSLGSDVAYAGPGSDIIFSGLSDAIPGGTRYYWVTADVAEGASGTHSIHGTVDAAGDLSITSGTLSGSSSYGKLNAGTDASLPVDLSSFSARCEGQSIILEWVTESETENLGFILERSADGDVWTTIASYQSNNDLKGQGNTSSKTEYAFTDINVEPGQTYKYRLSDVSLGGGMTVYTPLTITLDALPQITEMEKAYPNPFNPSTFISYHLAEDSQVDISVYDMLGRKIQTLFTGQQYAGSYHVYWHGKSDKGNFAPTGTYLIRMQTEETAQVQKVLLMK